MCKLLCSQHCCFVALNHDHSTILVQLLLKYRSVFGLYAVLFTCSVVNCYIRILANSQCCLCVYGPWVVGQLYYYICITHIRMSEDLCTWRLQWLRCCVIVKIWYMIISLLMHSVELYETLRFVVCLLVVAFYAV